MSVKLAQRKPTVLVSSNARLFTSFFTPELTSRLSAISNWRREPSRRITTTLRRAFHDAEALITTWDSPVYFPEELTEWAPALRVIAHCGGEVKRRFAAPLFERLVITNAPDPMAMPVAELAVALLLYFARDIDRYRAELRSSSNRIYMQLHFSGAEEDTVLGQEVGMIGFGRIGRAIARLLQAFGTRLLVHDPYAGPEGGRGHVRFASLDEVLTASKFLIVAAGLTEETGGLLNRKRLEKLPKGAAIINVARGGIIDLDALTAMVLRGRLRCALDVTDPLEPLPVRHPLRRAEGAIVTPHIGAISRSVRHAMAAVVLEDLQRFFRAEPVAHRVTRAMLERMT